MRTVREILRDLPESFWDVSTWRGEEEQFMASVDVADRKRILTRLLEEANKADGDAEDERIKEIRERADRATEGPWKIWGMQVMADPLRTSNVDDALLIANTTDPHRGMRTFNANFIASAREDVPWLLEQNRKQTAALDAVLDVLSKAEAFGGNIDPNDIHFAIRKNLGAE